MIMPKTITSRGGIKPPSAVRRQESPTTQKPVPAPAAPPPEAKPKPAPKPAKAIPLKDFATSKDPFYCKFEDFPQQLLDFARKEGIEPLKWRTDRQGYVLFSTRLQKYHIPIQ
jgi:hypothetical protein